jgi:hypothetical protein
VEAIDALEDAIEQVGDALPMVQDSESPVKTKKVKPVPSEPADPSASGPSKAALAQKQTKATVPAKTPAAKKTTTVTRTQISVATTMARPVQSLFSPGLGFLYGQQQLQQKLLHLSQPTARVQPLPPQ